MGPTKQELSYLYKLLQKIRQICIYNYLRPPFFLQKPIFLLIQVHFIILENAPLAFRGYVFELARWEQKLAYWLLKRELNEMSFY